jgi:hypothetical protein
MPARADDVDEARVEAERQRFDGRALARQGEVLHLVRFETEVWLFLSQQLPQHNPESKHVSLFVCHSTSANNQGTSHRTAHPRARDLNSSGAIHDGVPTSLLRPCLRSTARPKSATLQNTSPSVARTGSDARSPRGVVFGDEQVEGLEVPVYDAAPVHVEDTGGSVARHPQTQLRGQRSAFQHDVHVAPRNELRDDGCNRDLVSKIKKDDAGWGAT